MSLRSRLSAIRDAFALLGAVWSVSAGRAERIVAPGKFRVARAEDGAILIEVMA